MFDGYLMNRRFVAQTPKLKEQADKASKSCLIFIKCLTKGILKDMKVTIGTETYETRYFPFFLKKRYEDFSVYTLRYPSGFLDEILIFDQGNYMEELRSYLKFIITEYMLEEDIMLTPMAQRLKKDVIDLFYESERT